MANWAAISALGTAAQGAGDYFGQLSSRKVQEERLAQARGEKLADREHTDKRADDAAAVATEAAAAQVIADEKQRQLERGEGIDDDANLRRTLADEKLGRAATAHELEVTQEQEAYDLEVSRRGKEFDRTWSDPKTGEVFEIMKDGSSVATGRFGEITVDEEGVEIGSTDVTNMSESERKTLYQAAGASVGYGDMLAAMDAGYEPTDWARGNFDKMMIKSDLTNEFASEQGQLYHRGATQLYENLLRKATGAAAPDTEVVRYAEMFIPRPGDHPSVARAKILAAGKMIEALKDPYWKDKTSTNNKGDWTALVSGIVKEAGIDDLAVNYDATKPNVYGSVPVDPARSGRGQGANVSSSRASLLDKYK